MADAYDVSVTVQRATLADDGAGGVTATWAAVSGLTSLAARQHFYARGSLQRVESGQAGGGPGAVTDTKVFFRFDTPTLDIRTADRLAVLGGLTYTVLYRRRYHRTLQVDCELVA